MKPSDTLRHNNESRQHKLNRGELGSASMAGTGPSLSAVALQGRVSGPGGAKGRRAGWHPLRPHSLLSVPSARRPFRDAAHHAAPTPPAPAPSPARDMSASRHRAGPLHLELHTSPKVRYPENCRSPTAMIPQHHAGWPGTAPGCHGGFSRNSESPRGFAGADESWGLTRS